MAADPLAGVPGLVTHREVARRLGLDPRTIRRWRDQGRWPESVMDKGTFLFYRADDIKYMVEHGGMWPPGTRFRGQATEGE